MGHVTEIRPRSENTDASVVNRLFDIKKMTKNSPAVELVCLKCCGSKSNFYMPVLLINNSN